MMNRTFRPLLGVALTAFATTVLTGCNKAPEAAPVMPVSPITVGTQVDDTVITSSVKSALLAEPDIKSFDLQVETRKGRVQLSGFVESQTQIDRALAVARGVVGVIEVDNAITLKGAPSTVGTKIDDATVTARVNAALLADPGIKSFDISVHTFKGEVQLTGFVNDQQQIDKATQLARATEGAVNVKNELRLKH